MIKNINLFYLPILVILLSGLTASIILFASSKIIAAVALLPIFTFFYINPTNFIKIVLPMVMITFPITLQAFGKDAFSTGTLIIFSTLAWSMTKHKLNTTISNNRFIFSLLFLIAGIGLVGMVTKTPVEYWGPAIRHYFNLISSISLFLLIIHGQRIRGMAENKREYIEKLITTMLLIAALHIFLCFLILNYPWIEQYFSIFLKRSQEHLAGNLVEGFYVRAISVFTGGEELGELLVLLFPFVIYKLFTSRKKIYSLFAVSLLFGVIISGTRSAFLLIAIQSFTFIVIFIPAKYNRRKIVLTITFSIVGFLMLPVFLKYGPILMDRMQETIGQVFQSEDIENITNRYRVWPMAYKITTSTISLFGHGPVQAHVISFHALNFHNLYLTLVFQFGVVGSICFIVFFLSLAKPLYVAAKLQRSEKGPFYLLAIACLLSLFSFLINEIKFEFNRSDSYQQFVWGIFAVYYLTGTMCQNPKNEKAFNN
ncbi:O-antigen ligase family protein [bacterium]|nr:O-antigen ligase family protein [bacterium]